MTMADLREIADPSRFVGRAPEQVDRFLAEWVQPALERLETGANERLGEPNVRV
jgi:adenylosuccinate lyase